MATLRTTQDVLQALADASLKEHLHVNIELKEDWSQKHGDKISGLANKLDQIVSFLVIGVSDAGIPVGRNEKWARKTEEVVSQHINSLLDPVQACSSISCHETNGSWLILVTIRNPGEVTYWDTKAYCAAGTTVEEMEPQAILKLRIQLPGLIDYTKQHFKCPYDADLVQKFAEQVASREHSTEFLSPTDKLLPLRILGLVERQAARILFGNCPYRIIYYDGHGDPIKNTKGTGLYRLLLPEFIESIAHHNSCRYSAKALKEGFANAVAHAAFFEGDGEIMLEIFPDRLMVSNLCLRESIYFANRWFSRSHKTVNGLLMEALRVAGSVDELGRGKHLIFSESIKMGQQAPEVIIEKAGKYERWKLLIFGATSHANLLRVLERSRELYPDERKALIAQALVLWRDKPVAEIRNFVDGDFAKLFAEVLSGLEGPIFYYEKEDKITLRRWAEVLMGEGKDSKDFSAGEENRLQNTLYDYCLEHNNSIVTPALLREWAGMANTKSEKVLSSTILARWSEKGVVSKVGHGKFQFVPRLALPLTESFESIWKLFNVDDSKNLFEGLLRPSDENK